MKVVVAFDSFKGSATAGEVVDAVGRAFADVLTGCEVVAIPIADGGEGMVAAIVRVSSDGVVWVDCETVDPLMRPVKAGYAMIDGGATAVIELAAASGLPLVEPQRRNPLATTTYGTGVLVKDALDRGCRRFIVGLGGSATNDGGMGLLAALGYRFVDADGNALPPVGGSLQRVAMIDGNAVDCRLAECHFTAACDVTNPLVGEMGAARVFAPQKGADGRMVECLDKGLAAYADVVKRYCGKEIAALPGAGAAGGVGGGIAALLGAELKPGSEIVLDMARFDEALAGADWVVTGEGRIDEQTGMGKAVGAVLGRAARAGVPVIGIAGAIDIDTVDDGQFAALFSIQQAPVSLDEAMRRETALRNAYFTARQAAKLIAASVALSGAKQ